MIVYCKSEECKWNKNCECNRGIISLDYDNECEDFESYLDDAEWQKPYWKRFIDTKTNQIYRVLFHGKEIEIGGLKFFVDTDSDYATVTEEITGLSCGKRCDLDCRIEEITGAISKRDIPPLATLPIGEYDEKTGRVKPPRADRKGSE